MRRLSVILAISAVVLLFGFGSAKATVLNFEDISAIFGTIYNGYGGLTWDNLYVLNGTDYYTPSGYKNGIVSPDNVAYNGYGNPATISGDEFDFNSVYLAGVWNDDLNIQVKGLLDGTQLYTQTVVVDSDGPTLFNFNYEGIDELQFISSGGTDHGYEGSGTHFAMDNFDYTLGGGGGAAAVPEPASMSLLGLGLLGLAGLRKKQK